MRTKTAANELALGASVVQVVDTLYGASETTEQVSAMYCSVKDHLLVIELRKDKVLCHILRTSLNATLTCNN